MASIVVENEDEFIELIRENNVKNQLRKEC